MVCVNTPALRPTGAGTRWWADLDSIWEQEKLKTRNMLEKPHHTHLSSAHWNDGGLSFFTKEHLAVYIEAGPKVTFFQEKAHFSQFLGDVLRTLCWAVLDLKTHQRISDSWH